MIFNIIVGHIKHSLKYPTVSRNNTWTIALGKGRPMLHHFSKLAEINISQGSLIAHRIFPRGIF